MPGWLMIFAAWILPLMLFSVLAFALMRGVPVYEVFTRGAAEGLTVTAKILPFILGMLVAVGVFKASGAMELLAGFIEPVTAFLHIPSPVLPLALVRPLSGNGSLALLGDILNVFGPDSFIGRVASVMQGSTDTTFYILTVYFGSVGLRYHRHALAAGLLADAVAFLCAVWLCELFF